MNRQERIDALTAIAMRLSPAALELLLVIADEDPRVAELEALAREEGIVLPIPATVIVAHEKQGRVVDLATGTVYDDVTASPTRSAKAVCYLLGEVEGVVSL